MLTKFVEAPDSDLEPFVEDTTTPEVIEQPTPMPNIYIDQIIISATAENRRELYSDLLNICQEEGVSIKALTETEMSQIGTIRLQRWIDESRTAYRLESWDYQLEEPQEHPHCHFQLISSGRHVLIDAEGLTGINLNDNQPYAIAPLTNMDASLLLRTPARQDKKSSGKMNDVAGQPCVESTITGYEDAVTCTWSGGVEWGFEPHSDGVESVVDTNHYVFFRSIILQQEPAGKALDKISTITFNIGDKLDETAMQPAPATALPAQQP
ncbi:hypothetical protein [Methylophaga sp.]|uniref:hypothetical protein n=1 Tax=Methylophaga sp. TaxID=2024840 RepID=UPI003A8F0A4E